eukprot:11152292-Prorocentrum_lima.AAC.1
MPHWYEERHVMTGREIIQELAAAQARIEQRQPVKFCAAAEPFYTPDGLPLQTVVEPKMRQHSCLYAAFATFLGFHGEKNPISKVKRHCGRELEQFASYFLTDGMASVGMLKTLRRGLQG